MVDVQHLAKCLVYNAAAAAAAAAAKSLETCLTLCNPMAVHQAPLSLGFSRQEYWSRLPFSSPLHESEK